MAIDPRKWSAFADFWSANFRKLKEDDGLSEWAEFVEISDLKLIKIAAQPLADRFAEQMEHMEPAKMPTLQMLKRCYFRAKSEQQESCDSQRYGGRANCAICHGSGWVWVLAPRHSDLESRNLWPEDFRKFPREQFTGCETAPCPQCRKARWDGDDRRRRAERNSVPLDVYHGDRDFPEAEMSPATRCGGLLAIEIWVGVHPITQAAKVTD